MELFKLFGTIAVRNSEANNAIDETNDRAQSFSQKMSDKFETIGTNATRLGTKLSLGLTTPITYIGTKAVQATASFEAAMSQVGAISGATGEDLAALRNKAEEMGKTTKFSASESAEALTYMAMAGWKTGDMLDGLEGVLNLAAASGAELGTTSDIVTDALTAMGYSAGYAGRLADVMAAASGNANTNVELMGETFKYAGTMAGTMGYSMEDVALAIGLMANSGIKGSMAGTSLNAIISRLATNTNGAADCINGLGVEFYNADGTARNFGDVMSELREATKGLTTEQKAEIASTIAGEEAKKGLLAILNASSSDYDKLSTAINGSSGAAKQMADTMNDNLNGQLTLLKSQLESLAIQFVTLIMPYLKQAVAWLSKVCDWIAGLDDGTKKLIIAVAAVLAAAGPVLIFFGKVATGVGSIISVGSKLVGGIGGLIGKVGGAGGLIPALAAIPAPVWIIIAVIGAAIAIGVLLYKNWDEIKEWAGKTWENIKNTVGSAVDAIKGFFGGIIDFVKGNWQGLALLLVNPFAGGFKLLYDNCESFRGFIDNFLGNIKAGFHNFASNISEKTGELRDNVVSKTKELGERTAEKFHQMQENISHKVENIRENTSNKFNEIKENTVQKVNELKENTVSKFNELKDRAAEKIDHLKSSTAEKFNQIRTDAVEKVNSLKENTVSKLNELKDKAADKINALREKGVAGFEALRAKGLEKIDNLRAGISEKMDAVKNFVSNTVQKLKDFFNFDWKLPHIKLPHFSMEGSFSLNPPSIPHIGVEWYKKAMDAPVIMDKPTAFGINSSGEIMAGGEAGSEVVSGTQTLMNMISAAVAENNDQLYEVLNKIYDLLAEYLPASDNQQIVLDSGVLVGELAQPMNEELGRITHMRGRRN
ncbi:MAG: phage tail tape measure protein [Lachnospiraceae bacterium]|nr:phage tail tape measure protein, TP901 family, core region [Lachnospiraceae bacterium 10-1]MCX4350386.1 phage tail tape measure protein [Lachnospiraceae bacterium]